jgi:Flp pilus assembly protein TadD
VWDGPRGLSRTDGGGCPGCASIAVDYPADGSIFPPEMIAPTFLWHDPSKSAAVWRIEVGFGGGPPLRTVSKGQRQRVGPIDPDCVSETNQLPRLTPRQAAAHTWKPAPALWNAIKQRSADGPATVTITGFSGAKMERPVSRGRMTLRTSKDPAGAPIFYRDVPLMPTETEKGVIKPLAAEAVRLIAWRLRNLAEPQSRVVMDHIPVCANCHSFSGDGKTLGMDLDGLQNNKGLYTLTPVARETSIGSENVIQWSTSKGRLESALRVGFMSQVSPDGEYVVTTVDPGQAAGSNYYVANFKDYRFLQVFYPTRGILMWYSRATGVLRPLPGADDPRFVQMGAVWSPDGKYLVFARAAAKDPNPAGVPLAKFANDPNETPIQYDLYRIPFNAGKGGAAEPVEGASRDGMSNSFPKISPDGRWIVFVKAHNGLLMRPDSRLYIVPAAGGEARRMRSNTSRMNSWHSFSPNGRWLVFSSKSRSPYTQMYLTHIDPAGNDSPAILVENSTASNRAVNLPEFVNIPPDGLRSIGGPALDYYRRFDRAAYLQKEKRFEEAATEWRKVAAIRPDDALARGNLGMALLAAGRREEAGTELRKAQELKLRQALEAGPSAPAHNNLGAMLLDEGRTDEAIRQFEDAIGADPQFAAARANLGRALESKGRLDEALVELRKAVDLAPRYAPALDALGTVLAHRGEAGEAIRQWRKALEIDPDDARAHAGLGAALYAPGSFDEALRHWRAAAGFAPNDTATLRQAAWALATCPEAQFRSGAEAVALAVRAVQLSAGKDAAVLDTLAAAYAEKQQFEDALSTARRALALAARENRSELAEAIRGRIALYEKRETSRER